MELSEHDLMAVYLTLKLAAVVTFILLIIGTPIAWWLSKTNSFLKGPISAIIAMPLVLPPTVLGFYLLLAMGPEGPIGQLTSLLGVAALPFTFTGIVIASVIYSLPFVVQPLQNGFEAIGKQPLEAAATLRCNPWQQFFFVALPMAKPSFMTASILAFAHTLGEFGVILMIGGSIPGVTRVMSVQIYDHVEALQYTQAHWLSAGMLILSFIILLILYSRNALVPRLFGAKN